MSSRRRRCRRCRSAARTSCSRCTASIASAATMPSMRSRWATIPTASRRSSSRRTPTRWCRAAATFPYPDASKDVHHELEMVVALKSGGKDIAVEAGARPRLRLCRRPRHDAARPAGRGQEARPPLGSRQGVRDRRRPARRSCRRRAIGHPAQGRGLAQGQRRAAAEGRPRPADLEGAGDDRLSLRPVRAAAPATSSSPARRPASAR